MDERVATTRGVLGEYGTNASDVNAEFIWKSPEVGESGAFGGGDGRVSVTVGLIRRNCRDTLNGAYIADSAATPPLHRNSHGRIFGYCWLLR